MDLRDTESDAAFRAELRAWLAEVLPTVGPEPAADDWEGRRAYDTGWQRMLFDAGYAGINWPSDCGGRGATPAEHLIFLEETEHVGAPYVGVNFVGLLHGGPTIIAEGNEEQRRFHLPGRTVEDLRLHEVELEPWEDVEDPGGGELPDFQRCAADVVPLVPQLHGFLTERQVQ